jgi:hypothetical protein
VKVDREDIIKSAPEVVNLIIAQMLLLTYNAAFILSLLSKNKPPLEIE